MSTASRTNTHALSQRRAVEATATNEYITRQRVDELEKRIENMDRCYGFLLGGVNDCAEVLKARGFWGRLRWLFLGR